MSFLPSMWNLVISTIVFFVAAWYSHRVLDEHGMPKGMTRGLLVFTLASIVSWAAGNAADWAHDKIEGPPPAKHASASGDDMSQLLKALNQTQQ